MRLFLILQMLTFSVMAAESDYRDQFCAGKGQAEVVLSDRTRVDCETLGYAIEVDYARKWAEAVGQSLHYALMTNKRPGILLITESESDCKYLDRLTRITNTTTPRIEVWTIGPHTCTHAQPAPINAPP